MDTKTGRELAGLAVMTLTGGERLGRIHDVIFHSGTGHVTGFTVDPGGLLARHKYLAASAVQSVGADALTVTSKDVLLDTTPATDPAEIASKSLDGRPVLNQTGTAVGKVSDVVVDTAALAIMSLLLTTGILDNALHGRPAVPFSFVQAIGADSVIISNDYDPKNPPVQV
jgi:uncharacterized protein YrrD